MLRHRRIESLDAALLCGPAERLKQMGFARSTGAGDKNNRIRRCAIGTQRRKVLLQSVDRFAIGPAQKIGEGRTIAKRNIERELTFHALRRRPEPAAPAGSTA